MLGPMSFAYAERCRLAAALHAAGPDQPTLCEGWNTRDLAAHLWIREHKPLASAGMFVRPLTSHLRAVTAKVKANDYHQVVNDWEDGPRPWHPLSWADAQLNAAENFVHHEDVRRGTGRWEPRDFTAEETEVLLTLVRRLGPLLLRATQATVVLLPDGGHPVVVGKGKKAGVARRGDDVLRVVGHPGELLLWLYGRNAVQVTVQGQPWQEGDHPEIARSSV